MSSFFLFTGPNTFALRQERLAWTRQFAEKHGPENLARLDARGLEYRQILDEVAVAPFIASKRLVVVDGIPTLTAEHVKELPSRMHPDSVLLFCSSALDRRTAGAKALLHTATVREFPMLTGKALMMWMDKEVARLGAVLGHAEAEALIALVGEDQEMLSQELQKLAVFCSGRSITLRDVTALVFPFGEQEIWHTVNTLSAGDRKQVLGSIRTLLSQGGDPFAVWNILLWALRALGNVSVSLRDGQRNPASIASTWKIPPHTVRQLMPVANRLSAHRVEAVISGAASKDVALKTGGIRATAEAPEELLAVIDHLVLELCS